MGEIQDIVKLANNDGFSLTPCSSGAPHFRGDTIPAVKDSVILDLSEMNSILRIDKRNKVAMVEPRVTFDQLVMEVEKKGLRVLMPFMPKKQSQ
jgi:FAD/FMN-containing dehydrogenase